MIDAPEQRATHFVAKLFYYLLKIFFTSNWTISKSKDTAPSKLDASEIKLFDQNEHRLD